MYSYVQLRAAMLDACLWLRKARLGLLWQCSGHNLTYTWGTMLLKKKLVLLGQLLHYWHQAQHHRL